MIDIIKSYFLINLNIMSEENFTSNENDTPPEAAETSEQVDHYVQSLITVYTERLGVS